MMKCEPPREKQNFGKRVSAPTSLAASQYLKARLRSAVIFLRFYDEMSQHVEIYKIQWTNIFQMTNVGHYKTIHQ